MSGSARVLAVLLLLIAACSQEPSPTPTLIPSPTPLPTPTPQPTPTPTPDPIALLNAARQAAFIGDYDHARVLAQQALAFLPERSTEAQEARLDLAQWSLRDGMPTEALNALRGSEEWTQDKRVGALVLRGRAMAALGDVTAATEAYSQALQLDPVIAPWLSLWIGEVLLNGGRPAEAIPYLRNSIEGAPSIPEEFARREKLALAFQLSGNFASAIEQYETILSRAQIAAYRARIRWELAQALRAAGQTEAAFAQMREIIAQHPRAAQALSALQALLDAGQPVDELQRGIIGYYNGLHVPAREAFRRAIVLYPERANEVRYWAALNHLKLGSPADALRNLNQTILSNPRGSTDVIIAHAEKVKLFVSQGNLAAARESLNEMLSQLNADERALQAALDAAQTLARGAGLLDEAIRAYRAIGQATRSELGAEALLRAAAWSYRTGRFDEVAALAQQLIREHSDQPQSLLAQLWLGKTQIAAGAIPSATATLEDLRARAPGTYEAARAAELLSDPTRAPLSLPFVNTLPAFDPIEQQEAERWLRGRLGLPEGQSLGELRADLAADPRLARGKALWRLGLFNEARLELEGLRLAYSRDVLAQYQLALYFRDLGLYRSSIAAADTVMRLIQVRSPLELPRFIARLIYPTYYADLVLRHSAEYALDPMLVFALIRQESLFEPFAISSAAASGLMQVIPLTGREIHSELNWPPNYDTADLQKPYVSVRFGTYYLAKQRTFFGGDLYAALAAYNGGPSNSRRWRQVSAGDPDLFFLNVTFDETRLYIRMVSANYAMYHALYGGK
ncbi:MAG: transglycosylase SLT domain-containing protein [Anaerolineae bacterium]|nr:transglycosylase SLT domain-containing protein [Thermoflexales bacterium]MDW8394869.1 transglycosylase SLT domain-containing protein [Anaerolineae bacterium]